MAEKNEKEEIFNLCKEFYNNEFFLNYAHDNKTKCNCFLIEKELMDKFKNNIFYDQLKDFIKKDIDINHIDINILNNLTKINKNIIQTKFHNKQDLLNELENGKIFYVITERLYNNICKEDIKKEKGIDALFHKLKFKLFIYNKESKKNEEVEFKYNEDGTIGKSNIIRQETDKRYNSVEEVGNISNINHTNDNINIVKRTNLYNRRNYIKRNIVFKEHLEILIELYYYNKILKSKENTSFTELNDENKETVYLINNNWIENYKSFFEYKNLENELMNIDRKNANEIQNAFITDEFIDEKLSSLTDSFIEKINKKNKTNFGEIKYDKIKLQKTDFDYLVNNQIINSRIYLKLTNLKYEGIYSNIKKCDCYFVGSQKLLLLFEQGLGKDNDEIGYINNNIFIPEFLLIYDNIITIKILNQFFKNNFLNFSLSSQINIYDILDLNNSKIGQCYKLNNFNKHYKKIDNVSKNNKDKNNCNYNLVNNKGQYENVISKEEKKANFSIIFNNCKFNINNNRINRDNENWNQSFLNIKNENLNNDIKKEEIKLEEFTKEQIKILILYYLFIEELKKNIELSKTSYECYIIHKNYIKEYKDFYLYYELVQEIQKILSDNNIKKNNSNKEEIIFNNLNIEYIKKIKQNENNYPKDIFDNAKKAQVYFKKEQNIKYPDSFEIINKNIYEKIKIRKDNTAFNFGKKEYLINEGKIILKLDYPKLDIYEIIVGTINTKNNIFISNYLYIYKEQNGMYANLYNVSA